jgi:hypothetical protein
MQQNQTSMNPARLLTDDPFPGHNIQPQVISSLPRLVNELSLILIVDHDHPEHNDTPTPKPISVMNSSPLTLPQLLALLPKRRTLKPSHQEEEFEDVCSVSTSIDEQTNRRTKSKKLRTKRLTKGNESSHLHGQELEVSFSPSCLSHFSGSFMGTHVQAFMRKRDDRLSHYKQIDAFQLHTEDVIWI